ncbi:hypothetical protein L6R50_08480 [Myxococcota bacterium]|nr:hypothetical protein [Myxococcota bacterium]
MTRILAALALAAALAPAAAAAGPLPAGPTAPSEGAAPEAVAGVRAPAWDVLRIRPEERGRNAWDCQGECQERRDRRRALRVRVAMSDAGGSALR